LNLDLGLKFLRVYFCNAYFLFKLRPAHRVIVHFVANMAMSKHLTSGSCDNFLGLKRCMAPIISRAEELGLLVNVHILPDGDGDEWYNERRHVCELVRNCVETAYGRPGLTLSLFERTRFVITLSQEKEEYTEEVVGVIAANSELGFFRLGFECVAERMRTKGLATLLFNASDIVIKCLVYNMAIRKEPVYDICVVAHTDLDAPEWLKKFIQKMGFEFIQPPAERLEYDWGGCCIDSKDNWEKHIDCSSI
jgi:hypothetical protein